MRRSGMSCGGDERIKGDKKEDKKLKKTNTWGDKKLKKTVI